MKQLLKRKKQLLVVVACYLAVVALRSLFLVNHFYFGQDEARDILLMEQKIESNEWIVTYGPKASVGDFYLAPFYYQLHLIITRIVGPQPIAMHVVTMLVESASPLLLYGALRLIFRRTAAISGAVVYAFSYQPVAASINAWNPNMIVFCSVALLYAVLYALVRKKYWTLAPALLATTVAIHLHYQAVVLIPFAAFSAIYFWLSQPSSRRWLLGGVALSMLITLPYLVGEFNDNWQNSRAIISYFTTNHAQYYDRVSKVQYLTSFIPQFMERALAHEMVREGWFGLLAAVAGSIAYLRLLQVRKTTRIPLVWLLGYFVLILVMLRVYKGDKLDYYMSTLYPLLAVLCAGITETVLVAGVGLSTVCVVLAIRALMLVTPVNQLADLQRLMAKANQQFGQGTTRLVLHDDDYLNTMVFGLRYYTQLEIDQHSLNVLEVYDQDKQPAQPIATACGASTSSNYFEQLWQTGGYQTLDRFSGDDYAVDIARYQCQPVPSVNHPLYQPSDAGTDLLIPTIFEAVPGNSK